MATVRNVLVKVGADISNFSRNMANVTRTLQNTSKSMASIGTKLSVGITTPVLGLATAAVKTGMEFEQQMANVKSVTNATAGEMQSLTTAAKEAGKTTQFSATEAAQGLEYMGLAGWTAEESIKALPYVLQLAAASNTDLATTSDIVTDAMTAFGMKADEAKRFVDVLANTARNSNTKVEMMGEVFKYVGSQAGSMKYSIEGVSYAIGLMANEGVKGSMAGTSLRQGLLRMSTGAGGAKKALKNLNVEMTDGKGNFKPLGKLIDELRVKFQKLSDVDKQKIGKDLFGVTASGGWIAMLKASDEGAAKVRDATMKYKDAAAEMAAIRMDTREGKILILKSSLENLALTIDEILNPAIEKFLDFAQKLVDKLNTLDKETLKQIMTYAGIAASIGPILIGMAGLIQSVSFLTGAFSKVLKPVGKFIKLFGKEGFAALGTGSTVGIILGIVAALAALAAVVIKLKFGSFKEFIESIKNSEALKDFTNTLMKVKDKFVEFGTAIKEQFDKIYPIIKDKLKDVDVSAIVQAFKDMIPTLSTLGAAFIQIGEIIGPIIGGIIMLIPTLTNILSIGIANLMNIINIVANIFTLIIGIATGDGELIKQSFSNIWESIKNIFNNAIFGMISNIFMFINTVMSYFTEGWKDLPTNIEGIMNFIQEVINKFSDKVKTKISQFSDGFKFIIINGLELIKGYWTAIWNQIKGFLFTSFAVMLINAKNKLDELKQSVNDKVEGIKKVFNDLVDKALKWGSNLIGNIIEGIGKKYDDLKTKIFGIATLITDYIGIFSPAKKGPLSTSDQWGSNLVKMYANDMVKSSSKVKAAVNHLANYISELSMKNIIDDLNQKEDENAISDYFKSLGDSLLSELESIQNKAKTIMNFTDIFSMPEKKVFFGSKLFNNLRSQVSVMKEYQSVMSTMKAKLGGRSLLYQKLESLGIGSLDQIKALNRLSNAKLLQYMNLYSEKSSLAQDIAKQGYAADLATDQALRNIVINITGNKISNDEDVRELTNEIVKNLRLQGVF